MEIFRIDKARFDKTKNEIKALIQETMIYNFPNAVIEDNYYEDTLSRLGNYIVDGSAVAFLAVEEQEVLGWIWCHSIQRLNERRLHVANFAVSKASRNKGVGSLLIKTVEEFAKENIYCALDLFVTRDNISAVSFYQGHGYEIERYLLRKEIG